MRLFQAIDRGFDRLLTVTAGLGAALMLLTSLAIAIQVFSRFVLNVSIRGLFDICVYSLVIFPFLTAAYVDHKKAHVGVDVVTSRLSLRERTMLKVAVYLAAIPYPIVFGWKTVEWADTLFRKGQLTIGVWAVPRGILVSIMAAGMFLLLLQIIRVLVHNIRALPSPAPASRDNSWLYVSLFVIGIIVGVVLFVYVGPLLGLVFLLFLFLFAGMSVFFTLGLVGMLGLYLFIGTRVLIQAPIVAYEHLNSFPLTCLPLFILGGLIMERSKAIDHVFHLFELWVGQYASSALVTTILVGLVFCATTGSSVGATAVISTLCLPLLFARGYNKALCCGLVGGCTVGTLIPPSIGYVIYAVITEVSVGKLFMAAIFSGLVLFALFIVYVILLGAVNRKALFEGGVIPPIARQQVTWKARFLSFKDAVWGLLTPVIVLGGIYLGMFTPTEAAGALVIYAILVSAFVTRTLNWRELVKVSIKSTETSSMILCIIFTAFGLALVVTQVRIAPGLVAWAEAVGLGQIGVLALVFIVLTILGMFMDAASVKVITLPTFFPLAMAVGIDPLWFGIFYQINMEIGLLTPPVGLNLFVMQGVTGLPLTRIVRGTMPFLLLMLLTIIIIYFFPQLCTWLPSTMK